MRARQPVALKRVQQAQQTARHKPLWHFLCLVWALVQALVPVLVPVLALVLRAYHFTLVRHRMALTTHAKECSATSVKRLHSS